MFKKMLLILLFPALSFGQLIDSDVFPFGFYANRGAGDTDFWSESHLNRMNDSLGINQMLVGGFDTAGVRVGDFADAGIYPIPWESTFAHHYYGFATYFITEAEDETSEFRFETSLGTDTTIGSNTYRYWSGDGYMLDDLKFNQYCKASCLYEDELVEYSVYLGIKIDTAGTTAADTVGIFYAINTSINGSDSLRFRDAILVGDLPGEDPVELLLGNELNPPDSFYTVSSADSCDRDYRQNAISFRFKTFGNCTVYIDRFKLHCQYGKSLVEDQNPERAADIKGSAGNSNFDAKILSWFLKDEPAPGTYRTQKYIYDLIDQAMIDSNWTTPVRAITNFCQACGVGSFKGLTDFVTLVQPKKMMFDMYPFYGVNSSVGNVAYTGYYPPGGGMGLQGSLETYVETQCQNVREAITESDSLESWVYLSQVLGIADCDDLPDTNWSYRPPTKSELQCATYMGMCYHPSSILYYKYNYTWDGNNDCQLALISLNGDRSYLYDIFEDDINPYLKAIDSTYLRLEWARAYPYHNGTPSLLPPSGAVISSISSYIHPDSVEMDPDSGWFQIGEYADTTNAKYIMLVNRACSQGPANPDPAPSITATVRFNPTNLGLGDYVYIIDIADSIFFQAYEPDSVWADTTYSAEMPDGTIPFTTVLGPGEGRLFKIVETARIALKDTLAEPGFSYQGSIKINGDVIIPSGSTFKVKGPANFRIAQCDSSAHGGLDNTLVEIVCDGRMSFIGTENDSIYFRELYDCESGLLLDIINPGDWYGIRDKSDDYDTLSYCFIRFAYNGYSGEATSNAIIRHCRISNSENSGIRLVNACRDTLNVDSCLISDNGSHGIEATISCLIADGNTITKNTSSGVYIVENGTIPCGDLDYRLANNTITQGDDYSTQKGVNVIGRWDSNPSVVFEGNMIEDFSSSGVHLYRVKVGDWNSETGTRFIGYNKIESNSTYGLWCQYSSPAIYTEGRCDSYNSFSYNSSYGIYCSNSSNPKIKKTKLYDNSTSNLTCVTFSSPNLGETSSFDGNNQFRTVLYDIKVGGLTIIKAQMNYWGEITPDTLDFYPSKAYVVYEPYRSRPCIPSGKIEGTELEIPDQFALYQNYPNPFNPATSISFDLPEASYVKILIYNILGQRVRILTDEYCEPGHHVIVWDSRDRYGNEVASGIYFYLLEASQFADVRKMLILR